jgi:hypothetical protein
MQLVGITMLKDQALQPEVHQEPVQSDGKEVTT